HHVDIGRTLDDGLAFLAGHAAAHSDDEVGVEFFQVLHAAQVGEDLFLGLLAHRTGVEQDDVGVFGVVGQFEALVAAQHVGHFVRVVLVHLAAERADVQFAGGGRSGGRHRGGGSCGRGGGGAGALD